MKNAPLFDLLECLDIDTDAGQLGFDNAMESVWALTKKRIRQIVDMANASVEYAITPATTPFEFSASSTLGGAPHPCAGFGCRMSRIDELAYFASLYADRVLVPFPFHYVSLDARIVELRASFALAWISTAR